MGERECRNCGPTVAVSVTFPTNNWCEHLCWPNSPDGTVLLRPNVQLPTAFDMTALPPRNRPGQLVVGEMQIFQSGDDAQLFRYGPGELIAAEIQGAMGLSATQLEGVDRLTRCFVASAKRHGRRRRW